MKQVLLSFIILFFTLSAYSQADTTNLKSGRNTLPDNPQTKVTIYPVPVRDGLFTIKSDRDISEIKITNIIGQDILREHYDNPVSQLKISIGKKVKGIYLCAILFSDGTRSVKKIMFEGSEY